MEGLRQKTEGIIFSPSEIKEKAEYNMTDPA